MDKINSYKGNTNLKQIGYQVEYTAKQVNEILKCKDDPIYFIEKYCQIISLDKGLVPFKLYDCQKKKVDTIMNNRKVIIMEGRQQGKTVTSAACILHYTIFNTNKNVAILANKSTSAREVLNRYQIMYENLPIWMQQGIKTWNKGDVELENGSKVFTSATTLSGIRGKSVNWLYIDEAAIIPNTVAEEFFTSTYPTIMAGKTTKVLLTSTPLGYNHFWKFWNEAEKGVNDFVSMQIPYWEIPGRDEKWAEEQKNFLGEVKFNQEVLCTFLGSTNTLLSSDVLARMSSKTYVYQKDGLDVLEKPKEKNNYFITVDTSRGTGNDYSAFTVVNCTEYPFRIVAKYRNNKISPLLFPDFIVKVAKDYNNSFVLVEVNDIGQQVADIIHNDLEYENMIWVGSNNKYGQVLSSSGKNATLGVRTTLPVKRIGCSTLKSLIEENKLLIFDTDIISEFSTFVESKNSFGADEGYNDDLVMCLVLFAWASNDIYFKSLMDSNNRTALYQQKINAIEDNLTPFGIVDNKNSAYEVEDGDVWLNDDYEKDYQKFLKEQLL